MGREWQGWRDFLESRICTQHGYVMLDPFKIGIPKCAFLAVALFSLGCDSQTTRVCIIRRIQLTQFEPTEETPSRYLPIYESLQLKNYRQAKERIPEGKTDADQGCALAWIYYALGETEKAYQILCADPGQACKAISLDSGFQANLEQELGLYEKAENTLTLADPKKQSTYVQERLRFVRAMQRYKKNAKLFSSEFVELYCGPSMNAAWKQGWTPPEQLVPFLKRNWLHWASEFGIQTPLRVQIYLSAESDDFDDILWAENTSSISWGKTEGAQILYFFGSLNAMVPGQQGMQIPEILVHELGHNFASRLLGGAPVEVPWWVSEGFAEFLCKDLLERPADPAKLKKRNPPTAEVLGRWQRLFAMDQPAPDGSHGTAELYHDAYLWIRWLDDCYGRISLSKFLSGFTEGKTWRDSFETACGDSIEKALSTAENPVERR